MLLVGPMLRWFALIVVAVFVVSWFFATLRRVSGMRSPDPDRIRRLNRQGFYVCALICCWVIPEWAAKGNWLSAACFALCLASQAYTAFRSPTAKEQRGRFAMHPGHCGQCGYDLTGNVTGICSECGWAIPPSAAMCERPDWAIWWSGWRIGYLEDAMRTLAFTISMVLVFGAMAGWFAYCGILLAILPGFMGLQFAINTWRVIAYIRRQQSPRPPRNAS